MKISENMKEKVNVLIVDELLENILKLFENLEYEVEFRYKEKSLIDVLLQMRW